MAQSATLLILPTGKDSDEERDVLQMTAAVLTQNLEDLRLAERIEQALHATGYGMLRDIEVFVNARIVRLVGRVPTYYLKQVAQVTTLAVPGTHQILNDLDVVAPKDNTRGGLPHATGIPYVHGSVRRAKPAGIGGANDPAGLP